MGTRTCNPGCQGCGRGVAGHQPQFLRLSENANRSESDYIPSSPLCGLEQLNSEILSLSFGALQIRQKDPALISRLAGAVAEGCALIVKQLIETS
jgi:hypothetical protein